MKRIVLILGMAWLIVSAAFAQEIIKIGFFDNPPHIYMGKDEPEGALVNYWMKHAAPGMAVAIEWVGPLPPARLFMLLQNGGINAIALLSKNPEREKLYAYPDKPFQDVQAGVAVLNDKKSAITSIASLHGLGISFSKDGFIAPNMKTIDIKWDLITDTSWKVQGLEKVAAKQIDAVYDPDVTTLEYAIRSDEEFAAAITAVPIAGLDSQNYSVFSKRDRGKFISRYNQFRLKSTVKYD